MPEPKIIHATIRDGGDDWDIECRFDDGQKYAAIKVAKEFEELAHSILEFVINKGE